MSVLAKSRGMDRSATSRPERATSPNEFGALLQQGPALPKRRPKTAGIGIGVLAFGALAGALTISRGSEQRTAIVAARNISAGEVITSAHLRVVRIASDTDVQSLPAIGASQLIDGVAAVPISVGSLVMPDQINRTQTAPAGSVLVGMILEPGELPSPDLRFGDRVKVLVASQSGGADSQDRIVSESIVWRIWGTSTNSSRRAVTLAVPEAAAVEVGGAAERNSIRLLVVPNSEASAPIGWPRRLDAPIAIEPEKPAVQPTAKPAAQTTTDTIVANP